MGVGSSSLLKPNPHTDPSEASMLKNFKKRLGKVSRRAHNSIWKDTEESLCSRAWRESFINPVWRPFVFLMDLTALAWFERDHCLNSNREDWPW